MSSEDQQEIADALLGVIEPGASWIVRGISNDVLVEPFDVSADRSQSFSPELETKIDGINARLAEGSLFLLVGMLTTALVCIGLHLNWFANLLGDANAYLQSFWVYGFAIIAMFFFCGEMASFFERRRYRQLRTTLLEQIRKDGSTLSEVYVKIKDDPELFTICRHIQTDDLLVDDVAFGTYS
ncbi:MAG: hypothetical protein AAFN77_15870 [Planctomycetota bacterium]